MNAGNVGLVNQDGLTRRQVFCDIVNILFDQEIYCEASETIMQVDANMDGKFEDQSMPSASSASTMNDDGGTDE